MIFKTVSKSVIVVSFILFISALFTSLESPLRYVKYFVLPALLFFLFQNKTMSVNKLLKQNILLYVFLLTVNLITSITSGTLTFRFIEEAILILLPILSVFVLTGIKGVNLNSTISIIFYAYVLAFSLYNFESLINISKLLSSFIKALTYSSFDTESWMAFPFGIFSLYFLIEKRYSKGFFSLGLFILSFKRISMVAFILSMAVYFFYFVVLKRNFKRNKIVAYFLTFNILLLTVLYFFINGDFTKLIYKNTGISVNQFSQGRFQIYNDIINHFSDKIWTGSSLGYTNIYLSNKYVDISFLHSDILKLIIEFGIFSFLIWMVYFMYTNISNYKSVPIVLFINVLFLSDNVFIYFDTLFIFYLVLIKFDQDAKQQN